MIDYPKIKEDLKPLEKMQVFNLLGMIETVSSVPTAVPTTLFQQIKIYSSGGTNRLYIFDVTNQAWKYTSLT